MQNECKQLNVSFSFALPSCVCYRWFHIAKLSLCQGVPLMFSIKWTRTWYCTETWGLGIQPRLLLPRSRPQPQQNNPAQLQVRAATLHHHLLHKQKKKQYEDETLLYYILLSHDVNHWSVYLVHLNTVVQTNWGLCPWVVNGLFLPGFDDTSCVCQPPTITT